MTITRSPKIPSHGVQFLLIISTIWLLLGAAPAQQPPPAEAAPEFRGMWVTRFEWPNLDAAKARAKIDEMMTNLARYHFNAVFFQVRGQADTFYPSPEEPWSPMISTGPQGPGWDPTQYAIQAAHKHGIEFHAYINTHVAWHDAKDQPPANPSHLYYQHCNAADPAHCDWLIHDEQGQPVQVDSEDHYVWIAPGVPAAQAYIRRQIMYVVRHYDVDGVHFDRARMPSPQFSHDPISAARQRTGAEGNPAGLDFGDWTRDQFTRMLCDLYAQVAEIKPQVKISAAPVGIYRQDRYPDYPPSFLFGWSKGYQDGQAWMAAGALDFIVPQIYWGLGPRPPRFGEIASDWIAHAAGRYVVPGQNHNLPLDDLVSEVRLSRQQGARGNVMFHYGGFAVDGGFKKYIEKGGVYEHPARVPALPWKEQPTEGILIGTLTDAASGQPITDARITRTGDDRVALSSGDGLYAFLKVPPGSYTLMIHKSGYAEGRIDGAEVAAGHVTRVDVPLAAQASTLASGETASTATAPATVMTSAGVPIATRPADEAAKAQAEEVTRALAESTAAWERRSTMFKWLMPVFLALPLVAVAAIILIWHKHPHRLK